MTEKVVGVGPDRIALHRYDQDDFIASLDRRYGPFPGMDGNHHRERVDEAGRLEGHRIVATESDLTDSTGNAYRWAGSGQGVTVAF